MRYFVNRINKYRNDKLVIISNRNLLHFRSKRNTLLLLSATISRSIRRLRNFSFNRIMRKRPQRSSRSYRFLVSIFIERASERTSFSNAWNRRFRLRYAQVEIVRLSRAHHLRSQRCETVYLEKRRNSLEGFYGKRRRPRATAQSIELSISRFVDTSDKANHTTRSTTTVVTTSYPFPTLPFRKLLFDYSTFVCFSDLLTVSVISAE